MLGASGAAFLGWTLKVSAYRSAQAMSTTCWFCGRGVLEGLHWGHIHRCPIVAELFPIRLEAPASQSVPLPARLLAVPLHSVPVTVQWVQWKRMFIL